LAVSPDNAAALDFLQRWVVSGPWVLTAISPDRTSINTRTFGPDRLKELKSWLKEHNGKNNLYFHVNPTIRELSKKANREDVAALAWLHVDIDPRAGEDLEEEQARALGLLRDKLPKGVPPPTCIIFSGGGYQGFWRLEEPLKIDGDLGRAEEAKLYNLQLEITFGADNCHNVDRIMRLPGTINVPDAKKRSKGRVEALAYVVEFNEGTHPLGAFKPAVETQRPLEEGWGYVPEVPATTDIKRLNSIDELDIYRGLKGPARLKVIAVQGRDPDEPKDGDNSRSAWLFDFCCQLVRGNVPDEVIYAIVTDPKFLISESVLELKGNAERYALRQIARAHEEAEDPILRKFNDKYAVIKRFGGRCLVITEDYDEVLNRTVLTKMTLTSFQEGHENELVQVGEDAAGNPRWKEAGKWWRKHPLRRQFETIKFAPERTLAPEVYNLWRGFAVDSRPGDCSLYLAHIHDNICCGNEELYDYVLGWMARTVQEPASPGEVALVLRGGRGVGKSFFAKVLGHLFGRHYMQVSNSSHLIGNFNAHLRDLVVLFADEAFYANDKKHESILKALVTESMMVVEAKGVDVEPSPNYIHLVMASNDPHVIPAGGDERRFCVLDVGEEHKKDTKYFKAIADQLDDGGYAALLHELRAYDLDDYDVRDVPQTQALVDQKMMSLSVELQWWHGKLNEGSLFQDEGEWPSEVRSLLLFEDYERYAKRFGSRRATESTVGQLINTLCPGRRIFKKVVEVEEATTDGWVRKARKRCLFYSVPSLEVCRDTWERLHGTFPWALEEQGELSADDTGKVPF
jgi:hypothetical protein